jgi:membrane protease YdiL (CAAX protease family)
MNLEESEMPPLTKPVVQAECGTFPFATWGPWVALGTTFAALVVGLMLSLPFLVLDTGESTDDLGLFTTVAIQICTGVGFMIMPLLLAMSSGGLVRMALGRLGFKAFRILNAAKWMVIGIVSYFAFAILYSTVIGTPEQDDIAGDFGPIALQILLIVIIAPLAEEVCFRGMLFGGIRTRLPLWLAAPTAGIVFGLLHYSTGWSAVPSLAVLGIILAVVYEKTGSLWPAIGIHVFNNALALAVISS